MRRKRRRKEEGDRRERGAEVKVGVEGGGEKEEAK